MPPPVEPSIQPWWDEMLLVLGTASCASVVFLLLTAIVCYKAIKRYVVCVGMCVCLFRGWGYTDRSKVVVYREPAV